MANYHRNDTQGTVADVPERGTLTFRSLGADLAVLRGLAPPGLVDGNWTILGRSERGRPIHVLRLGRNRQSPVMVVGGHHPSEWISVEVAFLLADFLVRNYAGDAEVRRLVDAHDLWIVPLVNPDGHEHAVAHGGWRANMPPAGSGRHHVDLNRNYTTSRWRETTDGDFGGRPGDPAYRGPSPAYAQEVRVMEAAVRAWRFRAVLEFHAFGRWVLFPWGGRLDSPPPGVERAAEIYERRVDAKGAPRGIDYRRVRASDLDDAMIGPVVNPTPPAESLVPGTFLDFVVETNPGTIALTVELEPGPTPEDLAGFRAHPGFNLPESEIEPTFDLHRAAILTFLNTFESLREPLPARPALLAEAVDQVVALRRSELAAPFASR